MKGENRATPGIRTGLERLRSSRVVVWGTGLEGIDVAKAALDRDADVVFVDDKAQLPVVAERAAQNVVEVAGMDIPVRHPSILSGGETRFDCLVRSPGVSIYREEIRAAKASGCVVTSGTAMWLEDFSGSRIVGVTGTKGKTTTAWLSALLLGACGLSVKLGGNMGKPLTALYREDAADVYVVEVSSFQAADLQVSPPVGVLTLLAPDHLDWHGSYERYVRDKLNLFEHGDPESVSVAVNSESTGATASTSRYESRSLYGGDGRVVVRGERIEADGEELLRCEPLGRLGQFAPALRGEHNLVNLCGALTVCLLVEGRVPVASSIPEALSAMPVLPSRLETVGTSDGIEFVNDALASNPAGTIAALRTFAGRRISLIVGGHDRGVDLAGLVSEIESTKPAPSIVALPDLGERLLRELGASGAEVESSRARTVGDAVAEAVRLLRLHEAPTGDQVVLFSPAAPTPIVEGTYLQRGEAFNEKVLEMRGSAP